MIAAKIHGEAISELPRDLYIPPEALEVVLDAFEGPLDLLLYLIRRHNLDILDIQMTELARQYRVYIEKASRHELAAEYLLMAALLIEIKSKMLLPKSPLIEDEEDPRAELVRRLLEYEKIKEASLKLSDMDQAGRDFLETSVLFDKIETLTLPEVSAQDLKAAWLGIVNRAKMTRHHTVKREELSLRGRMSAILKALRGGVFVAFPDVFDLAAGIAELVVTFLAILELCKERLIEIVQNESFGTIYLRSGNET